MAQSFGQSHPDVEVLLTDDIGELPVFLDLVFEREREALAGTVSMNCDACKWRRAGLAQDHTHTHSHGHDHHQPADPYEQLDAYHERIWKPL
jgi:sirohydrochlorin cobaltochelatase